MVSLKYRRPFPYACLTGAFVVVQVSACMSFERIPPQQFAIHSSTHAVRIVRRDGTTLTLRNPRVSGDTLYGTPAKDGGAGVGIPVDDIRTMEVREQNAGRTAALAAGAAALVGATVLAIGLSGS